MTNQTPIPVISDDQRRDSLVKAMAMRTERAQLRSALKSCGLSIEEFFELADVGNQAASGMRVKSLISAMPGYGAKKTEELMFKLGISDTRRVRGLGKRQRQGLLDEFASIERG